MKCTNSPGRTTLSRSSVETTDPIADELRRRDDYLRYVTGRAASTCRDHGCIVGQLFPTFRSITRTAAYVECTR